MRKSLAILAIIIPGLCAFAQRNVFEATTTDYGQLKTIIGEKAYEIDSLVVSGPVDASDFSTMWDCAFYGKLQALNLENADVKDNRIPDEALFKREVQEIDPLTFYAIGLREVILPEGITEIGNGAFRCSEIIKISLPTTLRKIGTSCFYLCDYLNPNPLIIPEGIEQIPADCFRDCYMLTEVQLPNSLKSIDRCAFFGCWEMSCNFPENLENISPYAFRDVCGLKSVHLPQGCVNLGEGAFQGCESLEEVVLPNGIIYIPYFCFYLDTSLKDIEIPSSVKTISGQAFCQTRLQNIVVPEGVETIGDQAFAHNWLVSVTLPSTLKHIGGQACQSLGNITKIISYANTPATCGFLYNEGPFKPNAAPLYVPKGTAELYRNTPGWDVLTDVIEFDYDPASSVDIQISTDNIPSKIYNLQGIELGSEPNHGVVIKNGKKYFKKH